MKARNRWALTNSGIARVENGFGNGARQRYGPDPRSASCGGGNRSVGNSGNQRSRTPEASPSGEFLTVFSRAQPPNSPHATDLSRGSRPPSLKTVVLPSRDGPRGLGRILTVRGVLFEIQVAC